MPKAVEGDVYNTEGGATYEYYGGEWLRIDAQLGEIVVTASQLPSMGSSLSEAAAIAAPISFAISQFDSPVPGPADILAGLFQITATAYIAYNIYTGTTVADTGIDQSSEFPNAEEIARRLGVSGEEWHRRVKGEIIRQHREAVRRTGDRNPDIGIDQDGNILLRGRTGSRRTIPTGTPLRSYGN